MIELNKMTTLEAKLDTIMTIMNNQGKRSPLVNEVGIVDGAKPKSVDD